MVIIWVIFWAVIWGGIAGAIAQSKGGEVGMAIALGVILGPIGVIIALFLGSDEAKANKAVAAGERKKCPRCAELVQPEAQICRFCGHAFDGETPVSAPTQ